MKAEITKHLISDEDKAFEIGNDVHFYLNRNNKTYSCFGVITDIDEQSFKIRNVEVDMNESEYVKTSDHDFTLKAI